MGKEGDTDALMKKAEKLLRPSMMSMRMKPAWDDAMPIFEKCALQYQVAGSREKAVEAYEKAAEANLRGGGTAWHAAKHLEAAAKLSCELKKHEVAASFIKQAAGQYVDCGKLSTAAECLGRGARLLEETDAAAASDLYIDALDMYMKSEMASMAHDLVQRGAGVMIRGERFSQAAALLLKWATICHGSGSFPLMCRAYLGVIVIHLYAGSAEQAWLSYQDYLDVEEFSSSAEAYAAENVMEAYCTASQSSIQQAVKRGNCWKALDTQVGRLAQQLPSSKSDLDSMAVFFNKQMHGADSGEVGDPDSGSHDDFLT